MRPDLGPRTQACSALGGGTLAAEVGHLHLTTDEGQEARTLLFARHKRNTSVLMNNHPAALGWPRLPFPQCSPQRLS